MVRPGFVASLLVAEVEASLTPRACSFVSTDPLVEGKTQGLSIWGFGHTSCWDIHRSFLLGFAFVLALAFALGHFVGLI